MNNDYNDSTYNTNMYGKPIQSYSGSRVSRKIVENAASELDTNLSDQLKDLERIADIWKEIKENRQLTTSELRNYNNLLSLAKQVSEYHKSGNKSIEDYIKLSNDSAKMRLDNENKILELKQKAGEIDEQAQAESLAYIAELKSQYKELVQDNRDLQEHLENSKKGLDYLEKSMNSIRTGLRDIALVSGLDTAKNQLLGGSNGSLMDVRNRVAGQFGMSSGREWQDFKTSIIGGVMSINASIGKQAFGLEDVKKYMSDLTQLGIYDTQMAEAQLQAVIEGNKLLGLSTETQAAILKIGKRSGNDALLQEVNDTIATLLNAQIGISKEQLSQMTAQSTGSADLLSYFGNDQAMTQLIEGQALIEKKYGYGTSNAAMNILSDLISRGVNSNYFTQLGGADDIINMAQVDAGKALEMIVSKVKSSNIVNTGATNPYAASALGIDNNLITLNKAVEQESKETNKLLSALEEKTGAMNDYMRNQWFPIEEQIGNIMSNVIGLFPFGEYFNIENAFYVASLAQFALVAARWKVTNSLLTTIAGKEAVSSGFLEKIKMAFDPTSKLGLMVDKVFGVAGILSLIAGSVMFIKDAVSGWENPEKYGNDDNLAGKLKSGLAQGIYGDAEGSSSNALKNAVKWGLIGAGIGTIIPGIGNLAGFLVGGVAGLLFGGITGSIGAKNGVISNLTGLVNSSSTSAKGSPSIGGGSVSSSRAIGGAMDNSPWQITSYFGEKRSYTNTKGQYVEDIHNGIDLSLPNAEGTPMGASYSGVVSAKGVDSSGANYLKIRDSSGYNHLYWHLQQPSPLSVGEKVNAGQFIGYMGSTGNVTGPHLHYGVLNPSGKNIDPAPYINSNLWDVRDSNTEVTKKSMSDTNVEVLNPIRKLVSANTTQNEAVVSAYAKNFGSDEIVSSVNSGFGNLINKLDELSSRQDNTEEMLKAIVSPSSDAIYRY